MSEQESDPAGRGWHVDRRVPLALIATIFVQTVAAVWWVSNLSNTVNNHAAAIVKLDAQVETIQGGRRDIYDRLIRVEETVKAGNRLLEQLVRQNKRNPTDDR